MPLIIENKTHKVAMKVNQIMHRQKILFATAFKTVECNSPLSVNAGEDVANHK